jgi:hypothetical protein
MVVFKKTVLFFFFIFLSMTTFLNAYAKTYEAEEAILSGDTEIKEDSSNLCSSGKFVGNIGKDADNTITFKVDVSTEGIYFLTVHYMSGENRSLYCNVNDEDMGGFNFTATGGWNGEYLNQYVIKVYLKSGANEIRFGNTSETAPDIDRIDLSNIESEDSEITEIHGPDGKTNVNIYIQKPYDNLVYTVDYNSKRMLKKSPLGLVFNDQTFSQGLKVESVSNSVLKEDSYSLVHGKKKNITYQYNKKVISLVNKNNKKLNLEFRVSNNGVAYKYSMTEVDSTTEYVISENSGFGFPSGSTMWMTPMQDGKGGWARTQPSYEDHYYNGQPIGTQSPNKAGWCYPALFKIKNDGWVLISETLSDSNYCGTRLAQNSSNEIYYVEFPQDAENLETDSKYPEITAAFNSPWRDIIVGDSLGHIIESTLITDVAEENRLADTSFIKPGQAAWSWLQLKDDYTVYDTQKKFIDFAHRMNFEYCLIDAGWDQKIGYEKIQELIDYAKEMNVEIILWYNSNGNWNDTLHLTPINKMDEPEVRREEMERLQQMGVKGIKVDFFGGDKQSGIKFYFDILKDAADHDIIVNFHGATIPRGWERTYPNHVGTEAVMGMEYVSFDQSNADQQAQHCSILPFTRNVVGPMDFTPLVFNSQIGASKRKTTLGFELALSVIFNCGIQHIGLIPADTDSQPEYVKDFLRNIPNYWEDTKFINGFPGEYCVIARKYNGQWWIGGINGTREVMDIKLDLSFLGETLKGRMITDDGSNQFVQKTINDDAHNFNVNLKATGGFVIETE